MKEFIAAAVQIAVKPNDVNYNLEKICFWLKTAVKEHSAELVVFPESITTGFAPGMPPEEFYDLLNYIPGPETDKIGALARELKVHVVLPMYEKGKEKNVIMNSSILISDEGKIAGIYHKTHPFPPREACWWWVDYPRQRSYCSRYQIGENWDDNML